MKKFDPNWDNLEEDLCHVCTVVGNLELWAAYDSIRFFVKHRKYRLAKAVLVYIYFLIPNNSEDAVLAEFESRYLGLHPYEKLAETYDTYLMFVPQKRTDTNTITGTLHSMKRRFERPRGGKYHVLEITLQL